jgi:AcrR family transcriptional regulator
MTAADLSWQGVPLRRVPTQVRSRDKVTRALTAADLIAREEGPEALNLPYVARRAGVSVGALYQYLPDREGIVAALVWHYHQRLESLFDQAIAVARRDPPAGDAVDYVIDAVVQIYVEEAPVRSLRSPVESSSLAQERRGHRDRMVAKTAELLEVLGLVSRPEASDEAGRGASGADSRRPPDALAAASYVAADAILHEAFAAAEPHRSALLDQLRVLLKRYLA